MCSLCCMPEKKPRTFEFMNRKKKTNVVYYKNNYNIVMTSGRNNRKHNPLQTERNRIIIMIQLNRRRDRTNGIIIYHDTIKPWKDSLIVVLQVRGTGTIFGLRDSRQTAGNLGLLDDWPPSRSVYNIIGIRKKVELPRGNFTILYCNSNWLDIASSTI